MRTPTVAVQRLEIADLRSVVEDVLTAVESADRAAVKNATSRLHRCLLDLSAKTIQDNEDEIITALSLFPYRRGTQVTSWLMAHTPDKWARQHWAAMEDILLAS